MSFNFVTYQLGDRFTLNQKQTSKNVPKIITVNGQIYIQLCIFINL